MIQRVGRVTQSSFLRRIGVDRRRGTMASKQSFENGQVRPRHVPGRNGKKGGLHVAWTSIPCPACQGSPSRCRAERRSSIPPAPARRLDRGCASDPLRGSPGKSRLWCNRDRLFRRELGKIVFPEVAREVARRSSRPRISQRRVSRPCRRASWRSSRGSWLQRSNWSPMTDCVCLLR